MDHIDLEKHMNDMPDKIPGQRHEIRKNMKEQTNKYHG
jgi:hypothetical protein